METSPKLGDEEAKKFMNYEFEDKGQIRFGSDFRKDKDSDESKGVIGSSTVKRRRDKLMEEARKSIHEPGSERVRNLVKAFERLLTNDIIATDGDDVLIRGKKAVKWALLGLQPNGTELCESMSSFCPSYLFFTLENLGLDSRLTSSWDSSHGR